MDNNPPELQKRATRKQLYALQCYTGLITKNANLSEFEALNLIKLSRRGVNVKLLLKNMIGE